MSDPRACCCGDGVPSTPCDTDFCMQVAFAGIGVADLTLQCGLSDDCPSDPPWLAGASGVNTVFRFLASGGSGGANTSPGCGGSVVWRLSDTCSHPIYDRRVAKGLAVAVSYICVDNTPYIKSVFLFAGVTGCLGGPRDWMSGVSLFAWVDTTPLGLGVPLGTALPNQNTTDGGPSTFPPPCESDIPAIGLGGTAVVTAHTGDCTPPQRWAVFERCDDSSQTILVDLATAPPGHYGFEYAEHAYRPTEQTAEGTPVSGTWTVEICPPVASKEMLKGVICAGPLPSMLPPGTAPEEVAYLPNPSIGAGNGTLTLERLVSVPMGGTFCKISVCRFRLRYRPTTDPATPGARVATHEHGTACAQAHTWVCWRDQCPPGVPPDPVHPCDPPFPAPWCPEAEARAATSEMQTLPADWQARQAAHLAGPLRTQARASGCRGCGDPGGDGLM